jgi:hypothetical protein
MKAGRREEKIDDLPAFMWTLSGQIRTPPAEGETGFIARGVY